MLGKYARSTKEESNLMRFPSPKLNYANAIATIALFVALGGVAVAAGLPKNSVGTQQLKRGAVRAADLRRGAVTSGKIAPKAVTAGKLGANAVLPGNLGDGIISTEKLGDGVVIARKIRNGAITANKLDNDAVTTGKLNTGAVTTAKLSDGAVTLAKLSDDVAPLLGPLKSGQTLRGVFDVGAVAASPVARGAVSFQFPLRSTPTVTVLEPDQTSANCAGLGGGTSQTPQAAPGHLCVYIAKRVNLDATEPLTVENNTRLGFGLVARVGALSEEYYAYGQWAVTAP
jgi:hypothetical protein